MAVKDRILIHKGEIDFYYPLRIDTKLTYNDLCEKIQSAIDSVFYDYVIKVMSLMEKNKKNTNEESNPLYNACFYNPLKMPKGYSANKYTEKSLELSFDELFIEIDEETGKTKMKTGALKEYEKQFEITERDYNFSRRIYGGVFSNTQTRINFPCFKIQLCNNEFVWLSACLYVFGNKMAVMKIGLPLSNVYSDFLFSYEYDKYISSINNEFCLNDFNNDASIDCIKCCFIKILNKVNGIKQIFVGGEFANIILSDYNPMPSSIQKSDNNINIVYYKIICAPINEMNQDIKDEAKIYIDSNCWGMRGVKYITSVNGRCLSVVDKNLQDYVITQYMTSNGVSAISTEERAFIKDTITQEIRINVEFAILIIVLKKLNNSYSLYQKSTESNNLHKVNRDYNEGVLYINSLLSNVYGTVREQLDFFEHSIAYYLDNDKTNQNKEAIDNILLQEKARQEQKLNNKLTIGSFLLTLFFGLKAINETLCFIRPYLKNIIGGDIAGVTISDVSFVLWICLVILMIVLVIAQYGKVGVTIKMVYAKLKNHFKK